MSESFIKLIRSDEMRYLARKHHNAFILLTFLAESARRYEGAPDGLHIGEAFIGGHKKYDMSEQNYRTAKKILVERQHMKIIETSRNRKKPTNGVTTESTKVKLLSSNVYDINLCDANERANECLTNDQRMTNDKLRIYKKDKEVKEEQHIARTAKPPHKKSDGLDFDFENWSYIGISEKDMLDWRSIYPHIDLHVEITKSIQWLKANPSKNGKSLWRRFLTGWLSRANESADNKKAYRSAIGGKYEKSQRPAGIGNESGTQFQASRVLKGSNNAIQGNS